ncbi:Protein kinase activator [Mycena kentingensis (nom. inval.)]|nr:Protein kinase activator [Mycena kentingensis (nom. inval.)]
MKLALRKSLNSSKDSSGIRATISTPLPAVGKAQSTIQPPQKVIRALSDYRPQAPQQLPFKKGDFFHVLRDESGGWYEAHNPMTGARGLVPKDMFEEFNKNAAALRALNTNGPGGSPILGPPISPGGQSPKTPKSQVFYAIVQHDFFAERADELDAKRGDAITVVAQSNREWFVAKPIGRIGRPGLIPVSFVEIHDPATGRAIADVNALMDRGDLPRVEDWKRAMFNYKQNSIALGVIDSPASRESVPNSPFMTTQPPPPIVAAAEPAITLQGPSPSVQTYATPSNPPASTEPELQPEGILLSASVVSFHFEMEEYWFRVDGIFQPYATQPGGPLPPAKSLILFRVYNDFYDFQVSLLDMFPREAGREPPHPRILPYMPGPAQEVDDALTATRRTELDEYVGGLCDLSNVGAKYVLEHPVVREFLAIKPGDVENSIPPRTQEIEALFGAGDQYDDTNGVQESFGQLRMDDRQSRASEYDNDNGYIPPSHPYGQQTDTQRRPSGDSNHLYAPNTNTHRRNGSSSSLNVPRAESPYSRSQSPPVSQWNDSFASGTQQMTSSPSISSRGSKPPSTRSRSGSVANVNSPSISAQNPQTAFVKIKIFDRVADDLIAIRVHPRVTHVELMDKVQSRLGGEVANLRYRDSMSNAFVGLDTDQQLRAWIDATDKHVLYAD